MEHWDQEPLSVMTVYGQSNPQSVVGIDAAIPILLDNCHIICDAVATDKIEVKWLDDQTLWLSVGDFLLVEVKNIRHRERLDTLLQLI